MQQKPELVILKADCLPQSASCAVSHDGNACFFLTAMEDKLERIKSEYKRICEKKKFANIIYDDTDCYSQGLHPNVYKNISDITFMWCEKAFKQNKLTPELIINHKVAEIQHGIRMDAKEYALQKCYELIAVVMRSIDMIEENMK